MRQLVEQLALVEPVARVEQVVLVVLVEQVVAQLCSLASAPCLLERALVVQVPDSIVVD